ncbi:MAG: hypothetical protein K1X64_02005 [Myxococcaceae bacterium]|nr:hypothetical protein [Myxococcaceae bacterium]
MKKLFVLAALVVTAVGCGSAGANNVEACKRFLTASKCGSVDISSSFSCDSYANTSCDISSYFDCASSHYVCSNGQYDSAKIQSFAADCAAKATCK